MYKLILFHLTSAVILAAQPEVKGHAKATERKAAIQATLTPDRSIPGAWIKTPIEPMDMIRETESAFNTLNEKAPLPKDAKAKAVKRNELRQRIDARDAFVIILRNKACTLHRLDGGEGNPKGYIILKDGKPFRWLQLPSAPAS